MSKTSVTKTFEALLVRRVDSTLVVMFNRPEVRNAINLTMEQELYDVLAIAQDDDDISAVVLGGVGEMFSAGHDLKQVATEWERGHPTIEGQPWTRSSKLLPSWRFEKPLIAAVHGFVGPHANAILMTCDFVIAARGTRFSFEHARMGVGPPYGPYVLLYFYFPMRVINKLWMVGGWMDADQALELHYVQRVVDIADLESEALRWAAQMTVIESSNFRGAKRGIRQIYELLGIEGMQEVGYEMFIGSQEAQDRHRDFFQVVATAGLREATKLRDQRVDEGVTRL